MSSAVNCIHVIEQRSGLKRTALGMLAALAVLGMPNCAGAQGYPVRFDFGGPASNELLVGRLQVAGLISRSAVDYCRPSVPYPRKAEARLTDCQYRVLQGCEAPALAVVCRNFHTRDFATTAPGEAGDLIKTRPWQFHLARRERDYRF